MSFLQYQGWSVTFCPDSSVHRLLWDLELGLLWRVTANLWILNCVLSIAWARAGSGKSGGNFRGESSVHPQPNPSNPLVDKTPAHQTCTPVWSYLTVENSKWSNNVFLPSGLRQFKVHVFATSDNGINILGFYSTNSYVSSRARLKLHPFLYWQFKVYFRYWEVTHGDAPLQKMLQLQLLLTVIGSSRVLAKRD